MVGPAAEGGRVFVVDDDRTVAQDVARVLAGGGLRVVGMAQRVEEAEESVRSTGADLVISDVHVGSKNNGLALARNLWHQMRIPTVLLTEVADPSHLAAALEPAIVGYVVKPFEDSQLLGCVLIALRTHALGPVSAATPEAGLTPLLPRRWQSLINTLSPREREILRALASNRRVSHISQDLFISPYTVRNHLKAIFRKFGVSSQAELLDRLRRDSKDD